MTCSRCPRLSEVDPHYKFYKHLKNNGTILRTDLLNNIQEILTPDLLIERHDCICGIVQYGYKNLKEIPT